MATRSRNLWTGKVLGTDIGGDELYPAPAGYYVVVKSLRIVSMVDVSAALFVWLEHDAEPDVWFHGTLVPGRDVWIDTSWQVLPDGAVVRARSDVADALSLSGSGAVLGLGGGGA